MSDLYDGHYRDFSDPTVLVDIASEAERPVSQAGPMEDDEPNPTGYNDDRVVVLDRDYYYVG